MSDTIKSTQPCPICYNQAKYHTYTFDVTDEWYECDNCGWQSAIKQTDWRDNGVTWFKKIFLEDRGVYWSYPCEAEW